ncbi:MAG TPA: hypothetical protein DDX39_03230 [Bacteroidales bacterium]|nr:MAG: hypothetical protein A2W98_02655 [Bacteroidetes bacterium GWF2_33_38]OFY88910.1 MAG: hypothetical protein A2236_02300 [Bacteroidetes bacterium RIFOXYA2_FULL_33_7]HBF87632.1 hypothetical protein [Bacteroidales bacterium]
MGTIKDYFISDKSHKIKATNQSSLSFTDKNGNQIVIEIQLYFDFSAGAKYYSLYIPYTENIIQLVDIATSSKILEDISKLGSYTIESNIPNERVCISNDLIFCNCIYLYFENILTTPEKADLYKILSKNKIIGELRDEAWMLEVIKCKKPLAFISHDYNDKEKIARPFAQKLAHNSYSAIWYDEFSLTPGDKMRKEIEKGIKESQYCILLLSKTYLNNESWGKIEFESIFTKELIEKKDCIIPIWVDITKEELYEFSPSLVNILGINWNIGVDKVVSEILRRFAKK